MTDESVMRRIVPEGVTQVYSCLWSLLINLMINELLNFVLMENRKQNPEAFIVKNKKVSTAANY